jgi:hypothetical protein
MPSGNRVLDIEDLVQPDRIAKTIANMYQEWEMLRQPWLEQVAEIREYIFATDTRSTTNASLPWKNSVHIPKLCQIRDNLHANYMAALFPNDSSIAWEGDDETAEAKDKREVIESYINNKLRMSQFRAEVSRLVYDWIDYGNCIAMTEFVAEQNKDETGETSPGYVGPRLVRLSPLDVVFNPTASSFAETPKIIRSLKTLGSIRAEIEDHPESGYLKDVFTTMIETRRRMTSLSAGEVKKDSAFQIDGFGSWLQYFQSNYVEILDFYGDWYDAEEDKLYKNQIITVVDRCFVIRNMANPSWFGRSNIFHCGWRLRPDNLYAMGPLDNLVGMQYRIDHLENAKSDAFDLIIHPVMQITGYVEDFEYGPGERIYAGEEGKVEFMRPDTTMLNADTQIAYLEQKMEEMAGAPKQAMGFRTPGEKTAYEVQILENGSNRIFINNTSYYEEMFLEPVLSSMLELARRNMGTSDVIRVVDDQFGVVNFMNITKEDLTARGKIRPIGARRFARNANVIQNLTQLGQTLGADPAINAHISGKKMAYLVEELMGLERFGLVSDNVRIAEMLETQRLQASAQQVLQEQTAPQDPAAAGQMAMMQAQQQK